MSNNLTDLCGCFGKYEYINKVAYLVRDAVLIEYIKIVASGVAIFDKTNDHTKLSFSKNLLLKTNNKFQATFEPMFCMMEGTKC